MRRYWIAAAAGYVVLVAFAIWFGGLNQDEGWYLYAANMVAGGKTLYGDFAFTQAPVMPVVYSLFAPVWNASGLLGARMFTAALGLIAAVFAAGLARRVADAENRDTAALVAFLLLGNNLYHLYFTAIPKTYALASAFALAGFYLLTFRHPLFAAASAVALAFAAGTRISLAVLPAVAWIWILCRREYLRAAVFAVAGFLALALVFGPFLADPAAREGLIAAQSYHALREGSGVFFSIGSVSRLVRWYLPVFVVLGLGGFKKATMEAVAFLAVFLVQMAAPFPYEDYQVPVMGLLAAYAAANFTARRGALAALGLSWACAFGNPLLEKWTTDGQDRFWTLKKDKSELATLREVAREIESEDPGGKELLTQDLYLAVETGRKVPDGLEMGPFAELSPDEWRTLLGSAPCPVAALSAYSFAILPPGCSERPVDEQMEFWNILKRNYSLVRRVERFGQNSTSLLVLKRK